MANQAALKRDLMEAESSKLKADDQEYDMELHRRFILWKEESGNSGLVISKMINRSTAAISQYVNKQYAGNLEEIEKSIRILLDREENLEFVVGPDIFCSTKPSILIWEVLQYCDQKAKMGVALAPSGTGKTETCKEYKRKNRASVFVTADYTKRRPGAILKLISKHAGAVQGRTAISDMLDSTVEKLRDSKRLVIIDDAHFLSWEAFEVCRKIHDCARVGVVYVGQERLYEQMKGQSDRAYLFDQIYRRIAIKRDHFSIVKEDVKKIANSLCPGLDKVCIDYLYQKARGKGRFGFMGNILDMAMEIAKTNDLPMSVDLLREAERFLLQE